MTQQEQPQIEFMIQKIFVKDMSFESPNVPEMFKSKWQPNAEIEMNTAASKLDEDNHEVTLTVTITAKCDDKVAFLVEAKQSGIFTIKGIQDGPEKEHLLGSYCPSVLFPYAREVVSGLVSRGGFPDLQLAPVNFDALFMQQQQTKVQAETAN